LTSTSPPDSTGLAGQLPQPWLKLAAIALVVAALGLPINDLFRYGLLVVATVLVVLGPVTRHPKAWIGAAAAVGLCLLGQLLLPAPRIDEGHNVFIVDGPGGTLEAGLPSGAFRFMLAEFDARYPPERRCDTREPKKNSGCWRIQGFPDRPFAFSADAIWDLPAYSRRVTGIDFADPVWLRLGFINESKYNWNADHSDIHRESRDRRFWALVHRWNLEMPWFVMYRFPADFVGSDLCWRGEMLWEGEDERFEAVSHSSRQCRTLAPGDVGKRIFGVAIRQDPPLAIELAPNAQIRFGQLLGPALSFAAAAAVVGILVGFRLRRAILPFALLALTLVVVIFNDASFIGGVRPFDGGDDGLIYDGFARVMLQQFLAGDVAAALQGSEPVFYYTPGMRYLRAAEHVIFGESYLGYLALILLLPFLVFAMFRRFLPLRWAIALTVIFVAVPIGNLFGSSLVQYVKWAARGFADPAAFTLFLAAFLLLVGRTPAGPRNGFGAAFAAGLLFALALFVRPNLAPAAGVLLAGAGLAALWLGQYRRLAGLCIGFLPLIGVPLHNWVYGGELVLFTSTSTKAIFMPPSAYLAAFAELLQFHVSGEAVARALAHIGAWLAGPSELVAMAPLNAAAIIIVLRGALWRQAHPWDPWLRLTAVATAVEQCVPIFYIIYGRYYYLTWLLTLLVVAAWVHGEGIVLCRRWFPVLSARVTTHPASVALARGLRHLSCMLPSAQH
jgi:hypothetical protein